MSQEQQPVNFSFRPAKRSEAKPLIGLHSKSGDGKTLSALYLARGFVGPSGRIGMIETESGRGEAYADILPGGYDVLPLRDDYSPKNYGRAIQAAERANMDALILDSASHEWFAAGGVLDMASKNQEAGKKGMAVWQVPKIQHQREFILRLLGTPIPLVILCMRSMFPMQQQLKAGTQNEMEWVRATELEPIQAEDILFEMFVHGFLDSEHKFHGKKYGRSDLRPVIIDGEPITLDTGRRLAAWAKEIALSSVPPSTGTDYINAFDIERIQKACTENAVSYAAIIEKCIKEFGVFEKTPRNKVDAIIDRIKQSAPKGNK